jgi:hypothetical protein
MAARRKYTPKKPGQNKRGRYYGYNDRNETPRPKRIKKLDMRKSEEFNFMLSKAVESLPYSIRGSITGGIYAIASRQGISEARDFVIKKKEEGVLDEGTQKQIWNLLNDYSTYR